MIPAPSLTLAISQLTASYGFFGNIGGEATGVAPLVQGRLGDLELTPSQRLRAWVLYVHAGHINFAPSGGLTSILHLLTSYLTTNDKVRRITLVSGLLGLTLAPYTFIFLNHINKELSTVDARNGLEDKDVESVEAMRCMQLISKWRFRHRVREGVFGIAWALGLWAAVIQQL